MQAIAERTKLPEQEVELLLMKSLSDVMYLNLFSSVLYCIAFAMASGSMSSSSEI